MQLELKIVFNVWYSDHQMLFSSMEVDLNIFFFESMSFTLSQTNAPVAVYAKGSKLVGGPQSLALKNGTAFSVGKKNNSKQAGRYSASYHLERKLAETHNVARPESEYEFMDLDFVSRCAVVDIQLGRSKVFLRREEFDRIEAMRSQAFIWSAATIQAMVRGKFYRERYKRLRTAVITIQPVVRLIVRT